MWLPNPVRMGRIGQYLGKIRQNLAEYAESGWIGSSLEFQNISNWAVFVVNLRYTETYNDVW